MAGFLLDTNVLSEFARPSSADARVDAWLKAAPEELLFASIWTSAEIRRGIELLPTHWKTPNPVRAMASRHGSLVRRTPASGEHENGYRWAALSARAQRQGTPLAIMDGPIAATAMEYELTVVTRNAKDFTGLGIEVLNPWEAE